MDVGRFLILVLGSIRFTCGWWIRGQPVFLVQLLSPPEMREMADGTLSLRLLKVYCKCSWLFSPKFQVYVKIVGGTHALNGWPACRVRPRVLSR